MASSSLRLGGRIAIQIFDALQAGHEQLPGGLALGAALNAPKFSDQLFKLKKLRINLFALRSRMVN